MATATAGPTATACTTTGSEDDRLLLLLLLRGVPPRDRELRGVPLRDPAPLAMRLRCALAAARRTAGDSGGVSWWRLASPVPADMPLKSSDRGSFDMVVLLFSLESLIARHQKSEWRRPKPTTGWLVGGRSVGQSVSRSVGRSVGWLVDRLVGWFVGPLSTSLRAAACTSVFFLWVVGVRMDGWLAGWLKCVLLDVHSLSKKNAATQPHARTKKDTKQHTNTQKQKETNGHSERKRTFLSLTRGQQCQTARCRLHVFVTIPVV